MKDNKALYASTYRLLGPVQSSLSRLLLLLGRREVSGVSGGFSRSEARSPVAWQVLHRSAQRRNALQHHAKVLLLVQVHRLEQVVLSHTKVSASSQKRADVLHLLKTITLVSYTQQQVCTCLNGMLELFTRTFPG